MPLSLDQALGQIDIVSSAFRKIEGAEDVIASAAPGQAHFVAVLAGEGELCGPDGPLQVSAGQLLLLRSPLTHQYRPGLVLAHGLLGATLLDGRSLFDFLDLPHILNAANTELFNGAIPELLRESAFGGPGSSAIITCLARRLVTVLVRDAWPAADEVESTNVASRQTRLAKIVDLMTKDPGRDYTLEGLASAAAMSRTHFHREFVALYGSSPLTLLRALRIKRAEELLSKTEMPIKTITARLGYRSRSHFCKIFKESSGMNPEHFRARHRGTDGMAA
ncbi:MAG: helix-turn-helix transcriptional regulator [Herbaspirillum sp.]|nr:helix-turn-helix transcriptional regulator [Herbaspirillum sp.]